jgi:hypothetical protein
VHGREAASKNPSPGLLALHEAARGKIPPFAEVSGMAKTNKLRVFDQS